MAREDFGQNVLLVLWYICGTRDLIRQTLHILVKLFLPLDLGLHLLFLSLLVLIHVA